MDAMCRLCGWCKFTFRNLSAFVVVFLCLSSVCTGINPKFNFNLQSRLQTARKNSCINCKQILDLSIAEKRRLDILMKRIIDKLGIQPGKKKLATDSNVEPRESKYQYIQQKYSYPEMSEIVSFPENIDNTSSKNILLFTIDVRNNPGQLEAVKAHLWILVKQRKHKRTRSKGKKIWLRVSQVDDKNNTQHYLTSIRTRVKKTRWQKIGLPVTLIQSLIDSDDHELKLKISCKKCGKVVRPILRRRKRHRKRKRRHKKRNLKQTKNSVSLRNRRLRNNDSVQPFLVISTRYKYKLRN